MLKNHILPAFGQRQSETITALEVRDHIRLIGGTRRETARKALALIKEILRHGVTIGLLQYNLARELTAPTVAANPMRHLLTPEDIGDALLAIDRLLPYLVLRPGELAGLEWRGNRWCPKMYADKRRANKKQRRHGIFEVWKLKIPFAVPVAVGRI